MKSQSPWDFSYFTNPQSLFNILENITDGFYYVDNDWNIVFFNKSAEMLLQQNLSALHGKNLWEMFPGAKDLLFEKYTEAKTTGEIVEFEVYYDLPDLWVMVKVNPSAEGLAVFFKDITQKRKLASEVASQKNQHEIMINLSADAIWSIDSNYCLLEANVVFAGNSLRYSGKEIKKGDNVLQLMSDEEGERWRSLYDRALLGESFTEERLLSYVMPGQDVYTSMVFHPIKNKDDGRVYGVACYARDITESKIYSWYIESRNKRLEEQEEKLLTLSNKLESILYNSLDIIASVDASGRFVSINHSCEEILGIKPFEMVGQSIIDFVYPPDKEKSLVLLSDITDGRIITDFANRLVTSSGQPISFLWSARWNPQQQLIFFVGRDATELHKAQQDKLESEVRFAALVSKGADMIGILNADGTYKYVSNNVEQVLGYSYVELVGRNAFDLIHPEDVDRVAKQFEQAIASREQLMDSFRFRNGTGEWRWIEAICTSMLDNELINGVLINSRDVTERKQNEEKLKKAFDSLSFQNEALKEIGFIQSHEVRRPLANILGLTQLLLDHDVADDLKDLVMHLKTSADDLDQLIRKIVETSYKVSK